MFNSIKDRVHSLIDSSQDGFIRRRSCLTQLMEVLDFIGSQLHNGGQVDVIYLDLSKAFDKVSHCKLLNKLHDYGFGGKLLAWFESCLSVGSDAEGNSIRSELAASCSDIGSPSGSILGPMLFLLYANSLPDSFKSSHVAAFADDTKSLKSINSQPTLYFYRMI